MGSEERTMVNKRDDQLRDDDALKCCGQQIVSTTPV